MPTAQELNRELTALETIESSHPDAEIKNKNRLHYLSETGHNIAIAKVLAAIIQNFPNNKIVAIIEAEILSLGCRSNPEDIVIWIENIGLFVLEIKSHSIAGIRSFENNVPQVVYKASIVSDTHIIDQPRDFAYKLRGDIEKRMEDNEIGLPAIYYAGWLPNISPEEVEKMEGRLDDSKIWLSDMLKANNFLDRLGRCRNLSRGKGAPRESLDVILKVCFGCSTGLRTSIDKPKTTTPGSLAYQIAERENCLKRLTKEQEDIIHHEYLLTGPKVIRGVAGSGKTIVLANVVADLLVKHTEDELYITPVKILVLCFNRSLVVLIKELISECFKRRKRKSITELPNQLFDVINIDQLAVNGAKQHHMMLNLDNPDKGIRASQLINGGVFKGKYDYIFIDEGQDIDLDWFDWIRFICSNHKQSGPSIVVFYDDAQNLYGQKRPGTGNVSPWKNYLGGEVYSRGLRTIMRVGHRNTNEILTFSFKLLLGTCATRDPMMATFADINSYINETIPNDSHLMHPNAGKPCIEKLEQGDFRINFAIYHGPFPKVNLIIDYNSFWQDYTNQIKFLIDTSRGNLSPHNILIMAQNKDDIEFISQKFKDKNIEFRIAYQKRDDKFFQDGKITLSTIHAAKGYTAHVCHLLFVENMDQPDQSGRSRDQETRARLHVACTRAMTSLQLFGLDCALMQEAQKVANNISDLTQIQM